MNIAYLGSQVSARRFGRARRAVAALRDPPTASVLAAWRCGSGAAAMFFRARTSPL